MRASIKERLKFDTIEVRQILNRLCTQEEELFDLVGDGKDTLLSVLGELAEKEKELDLELANQELDPEDQAEVQAQEERIKGLTAECEELAAKAANIIYEAQVTLAAMGFNLDSVAEDLADRYRIEDK